MGYYQGDPGFFSFLGKAVKTVASVGAGFIPGVGGKISTAISKIPLGGAAKGTAIKVGGAIIRHPVLSAAGAAGAIGLAGEAAHLARGGGTMHVGGMHISRKTGRMVRNRHMRVTNPKALRRALRRAHGFAKLAMKTIHLVHPKKKARFGGFKKHRRK
jgi:hypothetical protein